MPTLGVMYGIGAASPSEIVAALPPQWRVCWLVDEEDAASAALRVVLERTGPVRLWREFIDSRDAKALSSITTFCDKMVVPAALAREKLGLEGTSVRSAQVLTDKLLQRQLLTDLGLDATPCIAVNAVDELYSAVAGTRLPVVVKPRKGFGSAYTFRVDTKEAIERVAAEIPSAVWRKGGVVVEQELLGRGLSNSRLADYVSVETLSVDGQHTAIAVTGRLSLAPPFRERGGVLPCDLSGIDREKVTALAIQVLAATGVRTGVSHVEVKLRTEGAALIEINGRLGGHVSWLYKRRGGGDLVAMDIAAASRTTIPWREPRGDVVAFRYLLPAPLTVGCVASIRGIDDARRLAGVEMVQLRARRGTVVDWREGSGSYIALISGAADSYEAMHRCIDQLDAHIQLELEQRASSI